VDTTLDDTTAQTDGTVGPSRRHFLVGAAAAAGTTVVLAGSGRAGASAPATGRSLIVIFLRGGADGLTLLPPLGDAAYGSRRGALRVQPGTARPLTGPAANSYFALHPRAERLAQLYAAGRVAVVPAAGLPVINRSHFDAQLMMEASSYGLAHGTGWAGRWLAATAAPTDHVLRSIGFGGTTPASLRGHPSMVAYSLADLSLLGWGPTRSEVRANQTDRLAQGGTHPLLSAWTSTTLDTIDSLATLGDTTLPAGWPDTELGRRLWPVARLIEAGFPVEFSHAELDGWDTHSNQGTPDDANGSMSQLVSQLDGAIGAFVDRIGPRIADSTIVVMSEFGRRAEVNSSAGTDHGTAFPMMVIGGGVRPGVVGPWPGLGTNQLVDGDLRLMVDYRSVLSEVLSRRLGATSTHLSTVFPGFPSSPSNWVNVCQ